MVSFTIASISAKLQVVSVPEWTHARIVCGALAAWLS